VVPDTKPKGEPTHISRRWFELCAITEVMRELKSGDLCITGSDCYSDFRDQFVSEAVKILEEQQGWNESRKFDQSTDERPEPLQFTEGDLEWGCVREQPQTIWASE
jgi:hypothetical protein